jgi:HK97 gp10 family phage protein
MAKKPYKVSTSAASFKLEGVPGLIKTVRQIAATLSGESGAQFVERVKNITLKPALVIADEVRDMAPEGHTGRLKKGIHAFPLEDHVGAGVGIKGAFYWKFIEHGTKFYTARPFIRPAINAARPTYAAMMADDLKKLIADVASSNAEHPPVDK